MIFFGRMIGDTLLGSIFPPSSGHTFPSPTGWGFGMQSAVTATGTKTSFCWLIVQRGWLCVVLAQPWRKAAMQNGSVIRFTAEQSSLSVRFWLQDAWGQTGEVAG
jgi:hypothetical protein